MPKPRTTAKIVQPAALKAGHTSRAVPKTGLSKVVSKKSNNTPILQRPFLKWAGGKHRVLPHILPRLNPSECLIEPFVGSGAVFLNAEYERYVLADINADLINVYQTLKDEGEDFIRYARGFFKASNNTPERFYELRERFNHEQGAKYARSKAALFLYLNRHGYNGLCRYNSSGGFNVPFGRYVQPYFPADEMRGYLLKAPRVQLQCSDFRNVLQAAGKACTVYCDPPYVALSKTANFVGYAKTGFGAQEQQDLAELALRAQARGATVLISNHDTHEVRVLYGASELLHFPVRRFISCQGGKRSYANELLAIYA